MKEVFERRVSKGIIPSASFIAYVQYSIMIGDQKTVQKLVNLGFGSLYPKLSWFERIYILDLAQKMKLDNVDHMLQLSLFSFQTVGIQDFLEPSKVDINGNALSVSASIIVKFMQSLFLSGVENKDVWRKLEVILAATYNGQMQQL